MPQQKAKRQLRRKTQPEGVVYPELEQWLARMAELQAEGLRNRKEFLALEESVIAYMEKRGIRNYDGKTWTGSVRQNVPDLVDWDGLEKAIKDLDPKLWDDVLEAPLPSKAKLEALVSLSKVPAELVEEHLTPNPTKKWVVPSPKK
jgi:hypothetical protein